MRHKMAAAAAAADQPAGAYFGASPDTSLVGAIALITRGGDGAVAVLDDERRLLGIITDGDVRRAIEQRDPQTLHDVCAHELMTARPVVVGPTQWGSRRCG